MSWSTRAALTSVALAVSSFELTAAPVTPVGLATSESSFAAGTSSVRGQATLFAGDRVGGQLLPTRVYLRDGSRYIVGVASEGTIYRDHLVLKSGSAEVIGSAKPARVVASSIAVTAERPGSAATVYSGKDSVTVMVRKGDVKVARLGSTRVTSLAAGRAVTLRVNGREGLTVDEGAALGEATRVQSAQLAQLTHAVDHYSCLETKVSSLSRSFSTTASQLAVVQAARGAIQQRVDSGIATGVDLRQMIALNTSLGSLQRTTFTLAEDLGGLVLQHHPGPGDSSSSHTIHEHFGPEHHGQHGHKAPPPHGHHNPWH